MISLIDVFLKHTGCRTALAIVPVNTLQNWVAEFDMWVPSVTEAPAEEVQTRQYEVFILNDLSKTTASRAHIISKYTWNSQQLNCFFQL